MLLKFCLMFKRVTFKIPKKVQGQEVKGEGHMCAKIRKITNNSTGDCWNLLKFSTYFDHVTLHVPRALKVNGSKVKVTA